MKTKLFLTLFVAFATVCGFAQEDIDYNKRLHCHIEGEVVDSTFTRIQLIIGDGDPRVMPVDTILVKDGHFSHDLYIDEPEFYQSRTAPRSTTLATMIRHTTTMIMGRIFNV